MLAGIEIQKFGTENGRANQLREKEEFKAQLYLLDSTEN
jgi:hypothetical protein